MIVTLEEVKMWLRVDGDEEDLQLNSLILASEMYLKNATGQTFDATNELARILCLTLIVDWYENREYVDTVSSKVRHTIRSILLQLQYGGDEDES